MSQFTRDHFDYNVPDAQIAQEPCKNREDAKLFVYEPGKDIKVSKIGGLPEEIPSDALIVVNDSKVLPARLSMVLNQTKSVEVFLLGAPSITEPCQVLMKPGRRIQVGDKLFVGDVEIAEVVGREPFEIRFKNFDCPESLRDWVWAHGAMPLPPYIKRDAIQDDQSRYQTVFAKEEGSVAAPTAGLHLSDEVIQSLKLKGVEFESVTLHVGAGTFLPVRSLELEDHEMHQEMYFVSSSTLRKLEQAKLENRPIVVVGTTALRALESLYIEGRSRDVSLNQLTDQWLSTELFIYPKGEECYKPHFCDVLMTNFHQPQSTLFMLVAALCGLTEMQSFYKGCIESGCRLFSYGDGSILWLPKH